MSSIIKTRMLNKIIQQVGIKDDNTQSEILKNTNNNIKDNQNYIFGMLDTYNSETKSNRVYLKDDLFSSRENFFRHNGLNNGGTSNSNSPNKRIDSNLDIYNCSIKKNKGDNTPRELNSSSGSEYIKVENSEMFEEDEFIKRFIKKNKIENSGYMKSMDYKRSNYDISDKESLFNII
jgi:hypothetical protein